MSVLGADDVLRTMQWLVSGVISETSQSEVRLAGWFSWHVHW